MKAHTRRFAVAAAVAVAAGTALGATAAFANETGSSVVVPAGRSVCTDLLSDGMRAHAEGFSDLPVGFTVLVRSDGASDFSLVARSDGATTQYRGEIPGETGYVTRVLRVCAENQGDGPATAFLTIETDRNDDAPAPTPVTVSDPDPAGVAAVEAPSAPSAVDDSVAAAVQSVLDQIHDLTAAIEAAFAG